MIRPTTVTSTMQQQQQRHQMTSVVTATVQAICKHLCIKCPWTPITNKNKTILYPTFVAVFKTLKIFLLQQIKTTNFYKIKNIKQSTLNKLIKKLSHYTNLFLICPKKYKCNFKENIKKFYKMNRITLKCKNLTGLFSLFINIKKIKNGYHHLLKTQIILISEAVLYIQTTTTNKTRIKSKSHLVQV